jgi:hypothetical protein
MFTVSVLFIGGIFCIYVGEIADFTPKAITPIYGIG